MQRRLQFLARSEVVALQNLLNATVETFDHAVGLRRLRRGQAVLDLQGRTERVELMLACGGPLAQTEEPIRELLAVIGQNGADADRAGTLQVAQKPPRIGCSLCREDADEHPSRGPVDGDEEVTSGRLVGHLRQVFHVDVDVTGFIGLEGAVFWPGFLGLQVTQVPHPMPTQAAIQPRARGVRVKELTDHGQQVVERDQQRLAQRHGDGLLRRRQCGLKPVRRVAAILDAVSLAPFIDGLRRHPETFRKNRSRVIAALNGRTDLWRRRRLLVKMDQHCRPPSRKSLRTDLAMNNADRRGEM